MTWNEKKIVLIIMRIIIIIIIIKEKKKKNLNGFLKWHKKERERERVLSNQNFHDRLAMQAKTLTLD